MRFNWLIIAGFSLFWLNLGAQTEAENRWVSDIAEAVSENETTLDEDEIDNLLQHLQARPINLNYAQRTDLEQIVITSYSIHYTKLYESSGYLACKYFLCCFYT